MISPQGIGLIQSWNHNSVLSDGSVSLQGPVQNTGKSQDLDKTISFELRTNQVIEIEIEIELNQLVCNVAKKTETPYTWPIL